MNNSILDDISLISKLDKNNSLTSIRNLARQIEFVFNDASLFNFNFSRKYDLVVVCGMGGSNYGARIARSLYAQEIPIPIEIISDYTLPKYVSDKSLVICISYSGETEETLACLGEALERNLDVIGISRGGSLAQILKSENKIYYTFNDELNPSLQPRLGQGYLIFALMAVLVKLNLLKINPLEVKNLAEFIANINRTLDSTVLTKENMAKKLALISFERSINLIAADFLEGAVHAVRNPLNETGKQFANYFILPEVNHHLLEGIGIPKSLRTQSLFILINSKFYPPKIQKRLKLTEEVIKKNGIPLEIIELSGDNKLNQVFELIQIGSFLSFYLAILNGKNPAEIPWVDYFKKKLSR